MSDHLTSKERALLLLSELDGHLANAKWDANATGRKKLREACDLLRNPSEAGAVQRASNQGFADGYVKAVDDVTTRGFESAMANANQIRHNISSAQVELPADAKRVLYGRYNELVRRSDEPTGAKCKTCYDVGSVAVFYFDRRLPNMPCPDCAPRKPRETLPEELFDSHAVWIAAGNVKSDDVARVLDVLVKMIRDRQRSVTKADRP